MLKNDDAPSLGEAVALSQVSQVSQVSEIFVEQFIASQTSTPEEIILDFRRHRRSGSRHAGQAVLPRVL